MIGPEYAKIDQDGVWNALKVNRMTRVAKDERPKAKLISDKSKDVKATPASSTSAGDKDRNSYAVMKVVRHKKPYRNILYCLLVPLWIVRWHTWTRRSHPQIFSRGLLPKTVKHLPRTTSTNTTKASSVKRAHQEQQQPKLTVQGVLLLCLCVGCRTTPLVDNIRFKSCTLLLKD